MAFGPGLTIETALLEFRPAKREPRKENKTYVEAIA
jgi:hypothetical protein